MGFRSALSKFGIAATLFLASPAPAQDYCGQNDFSEAACVYLFPTSPVAGNPLSLQHRMVEGDFRLGSFVGASPDFVSAGAGGAQLPPLIGIGLGYTYVSSAEYSVRQTELPFSYSRPLADPRYALVFDFPLAYTDITTYGSGTARIYSASLGAGVRLAVLDNWIVTPTVRVGVSSDTGEAINAWLAGASVVSNYVSDC